MLTKCVSGTCLYHGNLEGALEESEVVFEKGALDESEPVFEKANSAFNMYAHF